MGSTTVLCLLTYIAYGLAIQCYQETVTGGSGSNPQTKINCTGNVNYCLKTVAVTANVESVVRSCGNPLACQNNGCSTQSGRTVCCCNTELCNGAITSKIAPITVITSFLVLIAYAFSS
ncbi:hypothetical protein Tcan_00362 [Toxocara canis]|uniref:Activin types I and II receptor domain-containing protein n=1 Tax=Toxocara canis TaxID=6265 RepID=A0A0B2VBX8_TOXCA|nr:hypothetical protein Tcan_00362 [Toxocara canis]